MLTPEGEIPVPPDKAIAEFDPRTPGFLENPYPFYARLRREDPVHFVSGVKMWWVTRYADVVTILRDERFGKEPPPGTTEPALPPAAVRLAELPPSMFGRDPPDHTRLRSLVNKAFTPRVIERLRPHIEEIDKPGPQWSPNTAIRGLRSLPVRF